MGAGNLCVLLAFKLVLQFQDTVHVTVHSETQEWCFQLLQRVELDLAN